VPHWDRMTPALYGIANKIAPPIIKAKWDELILPVLQAEEAIYKSALDAFAIACDKHRNAAFGLDVFLVILRHGEFEFIPVSDTIPISRQQILNAVFDAYWDLARDSSFWQPECYPQYGRQIPYDQALQEWEERSPELIDWYEESLRLWLSMN
jgi:hypothetical protein